MANVHRSLPKAYCLTSLGMAIEFVAMYFLLLLYESYERPRKLGSSAPGKIDFLSFFNQRAADWAFCGAGKFTWAHADNLVGCRPAILLASAIWPRESEPK